MLRGQKGMMTSHLRSLILLLTVCYLTSIIQCSRSQREGIRVGAFNVQTFGPTKYGNETLMHYIIQVSRKIHLYVYGLRENFVCVTQCILRNYVCATYIIFAQFLHDLRFEIITGTTRVRQIYSLTHGTMI